MRKFLMVVVIVVLGSFSSYAQMMTDIQIMDYVKKGVAAGKSEMQIGQELFSKGVTIQQLKKMRDELSQYSGKDAMEDLEDGEEDFPEFQDMDDISKNYVKESVDAGTGEGDGIFGHSIFSNRNLSFEPNEKLATPENYRLGPGDKIVISLWGDNETTIKEKISPDGNINISRVGLVYLGGLTMKEAEVRLKKALSSKYEDVSRLDVSLGSVRTIQVNVMAEVKTPGTYRLSSFSTVFNAIYRAGGVTASGSLRNVQLIRSGKVVAVVDIYDYIFKGSSDNDMHLCEGDIIIVPAYDKIVTVSGEVKRPMRYELSDSETLEDALKYAGGFASDAYRDYVSISRVSGKGRTTVTATEAEMSSCLMKDGDEVTVLSLPDRKHSGLTVQGNVMQPGEYECGEGISTVSQLIAAAGGLREDAFLGRALIQRENDDLSTGIIAINLGDIMSGKIPDVALQKKDVLIISGIHELKDPGIFTINGMVANPGVFKYSEHTTIEDLIILAGGLLDGASSARVDVARRVVDPESLMPTDVIGRTFSFPIRNGLVADGADDFFLEPYDVVSVRLSPGFHQQSFVRLTGEFVFPGEYVLLNRGEHISDIVKRAGGITPNAYSRGAVLVRKVSDEDMRLAEATGKLNSSEFYQDTTVRYYTVGIHFDKAIESPGSMYDIVLEDGDELILPEYQYTVTIQGEVLYPNTVAFVPGKGLGYYINQAGGYKTRAKRSQTYILFMNGQVSKAGRASVEPGCEIVVPGKPAGNGFATAAQLMGLGTTAASLGTMIVSLVNLITK